MSLKVTAVGVEPLRGKRIILERAVPCHAEFLHDCYGLEEFMNRYRLTQDRNMSVEQIRQQLEREQELPPQQLRRLEWVIKRRSGTTGAAGQPIGIATLADYQAVHNRAEFLLGIIESEDRRGGLSLEAALLVLEFAFHQARLHKLTSFVYAFNSSAQKNTLHLGFRQEGFLREHYFDCRGERFIDLYQNGLLREEFFANANLSRWSKRLLGRDITARKSQNIEVELMSRSQMDKALEHIINSGSRIRRA